MNFSEKFTRDSRPVKLSVCITTYQRAALLDRTLESISRQTRQPDELIISDDCSTDNTEEIVKKWQNFFPRVTYSRNPSNLYMPGNLNKAISLCSGQFIANLHDGDVFDPKLLEEWELALKIYPAAGFVFCGVGSISPDGPTFLHSVAHYTKGHSFYSNHLLHRLGSIVWGTVMARRSAYSELLPFDSNYGFVSDVDMWLRMCERYGVAYVKKPLILLDHSPTLERQWRWKHKKATEKMQAASIERMFQPGLAMNLAKIKHQFVFQRHFIRGLIGCIKRRDLASFKEGLLCLRDLGLPTRLLGDLYHFFRRSKGNVDA